MAEVVGFLPLFAHDASLPQLVKSAHQHLFAGSAGLCQHLEGEGAPDDGCQIDQLTSWGRQLRQSCGNHGLDALREVRTLGNWRLFSRMLRRLTRLQRSGSHGFDHEQRIAFRFLVQDSRVRRGEIMAGDLARQECGVRYIQGPKFDFSH